MAGRKTGTSARMTNSSQMSPLTWSYPVSSAFYFHPEKLLHTCQWQWISSCSGADRIIHSWCAEGSVTCPCVGQFWRWSVACCALILGTSKRLGRVVFITKPEDVIWLYYVLTFITLHSKECCIVLCVLCWRIVQMWWSCLSAHLCDISIACLP